jgi:hypothetical protein
MTNEPAGASNRLARRTSRRAEPVACARSHNEENAE